MAVVAVTATMLTNKDAKPPVFSPPNNQGLAHDVVGYAGFTNGDSIASTYRILRVPSNARIATLLLSCQAGGTGALTDVGLYQTAANGGAVVDADFFASAVDIAAALSDSNIIAESGVNTIVKRNQMLWEALGLSADPMVEYDVACTLTAAAAATGNVMLKATYVF